MIDKVINHIDDTLNHKQYVLESAKILCEFLIRNNELELALKLAKRCSVHDVSKFTGEEIIAFMKLDDKESMINPNVVLNDYQKEAIKLHWKNNRHHPEYHSDLSNMTQLDLMEMACDCAARSMQYGTDLLTFVEIRQKERFKFPPLMYEEYKLYCEILSEGYQNLIEKEKILIKRKN